MIARSWPRGVTRGSGRQQGRGAITAHSMHGVLLSVMGLVRPAPACGDAAATWIGSGFIFHCWLIRVYLTFSLCVSVSLRVGDTKRAILSHVALRCAGPPATPHSAVLCEHTAWWL